MKDIIEFVEDECEATLDNDMIGRNFKRRQIVSAMKKCVLAVLEELCEDGNGNWDEHMSLGDVYENYLVIKEEMKK